MSIYRDATSELRANSGLTRGRLMPSYHHIKAGLDFVAALLMIVALSPILVVTAVLIRLDSRGPAIYRQSRMGTSGRQFTIYKFRTMMTGTPSLSTEEMQQQGRLPLTRLGHILRKTSIDELPQLFNIIKGEMSFIGPRPSLPTQADVNTLRAEMGAEWTKRGITGLAQVMGRDDLDVETKVGYDAEYCRKMSLKFDIKVMILTIGTVLSSRGNK